MTRLPLVIAILGLLLFLSQFYLLWQIDEYASPVARRRVQINDFNNARSNADVVERHLAQQPIHHLRGMEVTGQSTTSDKYYVYFTDGTRGFAKPIQEDNVVHFYVPLMQTTPLRVPFLTTQQAVNALSASSSSSSSVAHAPSTTSPTYRVRRESRWQFQGGPELIAHYIDLTVGWNKTSVAAGRLIPHRLIREGHTYFDFFRYLCGWLVPDYDVPMVVMPWYTSSAFYRTRSVLDDDRDFLLLRRPLPPGRWASKWLLHLSDALVFGFLVDDHDRIVEKNWLAALSASADPSVLDLVKKHGHSTAQFYRWAAHSPTNDEKLAAAWTYLFWDNGLAFDHGPVAPPHACSHILCGPERWHSAPNDSDCSKVCLFREATVSRLRELAHKVIWNDPDSKDRPVTTSRLSQLLVDRIAVDQLAPLFDLLVYRLDGLADDELVRFHQHAFLEALDARLAFLLAHIDQCIQAFGQRRVLVEYDDEH